MDKSNGRSALCSLKVLELFAGIGGFAAAFPEGRGRIVGAVEIDREARSVYEANFPHPVHTAELASVETEWLAEFEANVWWMSPPCTPFSRRGKRRDLDDSRNRALRHLIEAVAAIRPATVLLENVVGFETSQTMHRLEKKWSGAGYSIATRKLCPSEMGWPNLRPRVYLVACLGTVPGWKPLPDLRTTVPTLLATATEIGIDERKLLMLDAGIATKYERAISRVDPADPTAVSACFASSYGRAIVRSGSYLVESEGVRWFSPEEVGLLMGFLKCWKWPNQISTRRRWHLLGNSLSIPAVRYLLDSVFDCETGPV